MIYIFIYIYCSIYIFAQLQHGTSGRVSQRRYPNFAHHVQKDRRLHRKDCKKKKIEFADHRVSNTQKKSRVVFFFSISRFCHIRSIFFLYYFLLSLGVIFGLSAFCVVYVIFHALFIAPCLKISSFIIISNKCIEVGCWGYFADKHFWLTIKRAHYNLMW